MITLMLKVYTEESIFTCNIYLRSAIVSRGIRTYASILVASHLQNLRKKYILGRWL